MARHSADVNLTDVLEDVRERIRDVIHFSHQIKRDRRSNHSRINQHKADAEQSITKIRATLKEQLDKLEKETLTELSTSTEKHLKRIQNVVEEIERRDHKVHKMLAILDVLEEEEAEDRIFTEVEGIEEILDQEDKYLHSLFYNKSLEDIDVTFQMNRLIEIFINDLKTFGLVRTVMKPSKSISNRKRDSQSTTSPSENTDLKMILVYEIDLKKESSGLLIRGCHALTFGDLVFTDGRSTKLTVYNNNGSFKFEINTGLFGAFDVTAIDHRTVAVTYGFAKVIQIIDLVRKNVMKSINTCGYCFGITYHNQSLVVCVQEKGLQYINLDDVKVHDLYKAKLSSCSYVTTVGSNFCFTNSDENSVTLLDDSLNIIWKYTDRQTLCYPQGIAADVYGNVFITGWISNNVVSISGDGKCVTQVLGYEHRVLSPRGIHYNKNGNILLIATETGQVFVYNLNLHV